MPIKFLCPHCQRKLRVPDESANQEGSCSFCHKTLKIPAVSTIPDSPKPPVLPVENSKSQPAVAAVPSAAPEPADSPKTAPVLQALPHKPVSARAPAPANAPFIKFTCPNCTKPTGFPAAMANEPVTCPSCQMQIMCPDKSGGESFIIGGTGKKAIRTPLPMRKSAPEFAALSPTPVEPEKSNALLWVGIAAVVLIAIGAGLAIGLGVFHKKDEAAKTAETAAKEKAATTQAPTPAVVPAGETKTETNPISSANRAADTVWNAIEERVDKLVKEGKRDEAIKACNDLPPEILAQLKPEVAATLKERGEKKIATLKAEAAVQAPVAVVAETKTAAPEITVDKPDATVQVPVPVEPSKPLLAPTDQELGSLVAGTKPKKNAEEEEAVVEDSKKSAASKTAPANTDANPLLPGKDSKDVVAAKPAVTTPPVAKPAIPPAALEVCSECLGMHFLPFVPPHSYQWVDGDPASKPEQSVPWRPCPKCNKEFDTNSLVTAETDRLVRADQIRAIWDSIFSTKTTRAETAYVLVVTQGPASMAKALTTSLNKLTTHLQTVTKSIALTPTRPDTHLMVFANGDAGWKKLYENWGKDKFTVPESDFIKVGGTSTRYLALAHPETARTLEAQHFAVFQYGHMLMKEAANGKAPPWLEEGFAAYCENQMFDKNICYSFAYERNEVRFTENWNQEIRNYASKGQLKTWDKIFPITMEGLKALDYLTCYSMVAFFIRNEPQKFARFVQLVRDGAEVQPALERVFGKKVSELQTMWAQWALSQK